MVTVTLILSVVARSDFALKCFPVALNGIRRKSDARCGGGTEEAEVSGGYQRKNQALCRGWVSTDVI